MELSTPEYQYATKVMAAIEVYRRHYASGQPFQQRFDELLNMTRAHAKILGRSSDHGYGAEKFLMAFADALDIANKPGKYPPE